MTRLDEQLRSELSAATPSVTVDEERFIGEVRGRLRRRRRRHRARRVYGATAAAIVVVGGLLAGVTLATGSGVAPGVRPSGTAPAAIDPAAGPGGFSVAPSRNLRDGQVVTVSIHGLKAWEPISVTMCVGRPRSFAQGWNQCAVGGASSVSTDGHGAVVVQYTVHRFQSVGGMQVDCATYPGGCSIAVADVNDLVHGGRTGNTEAVSFAAGPPPTPDPLTISVHPPAPFDDGEVVTISGAGFGPASPVRVGECPTATDCGGYFSTVVTSSTGTFSTPVTVHRTFTVALGAQDGGSTSMVIDCAQPLRCFFVAEDADPPYAAASSIPLTFGAASG